MSVSLDVVPSDNSEEGRIRLTVVAVADVLGKTPGLAKHIAADSSLSVVSCSGLKQIAKVGRQPNPCVVVADTSFLVATHLADFAEASDLRGSIKILIVVDEDDPRFCQKLLRMGFAGSIQRSAPAAIFRRALDAVAEGELWASRKTISTLVREFLSEASPNRLTTREKEIIGLVAKGYKNQEIADALFVTRETVRWHLRGIYSKLGVPDRKHAIEYALAGGIAIPAKPSVREGASKAQQRAYS